MYLGFVYSFQNDFLPKIWYFCGLDRPKQKQETVERITKEKIILEVFLHNNRINRQFEEERVTLSRDLKIRGRRMSTTAVMTERGMGRG